jgi:hypothetical protein
MNGDNDDRLNTEQYIDMYRRLPRNSSTRRQIESLLNNNAQRSRDSHYRVGGVVQESTQSQLIPRTYEVKQEPQQISNVHKYPTARHIHPGYDSFFSDQFDSMRKKMDAHFEHMRAQIPDDPNNNVDNVGNYSFSKKTHSHTFVDSDGKKYTDMNIHTNKNTNGERSATSKRVLRRDGDEVTVIKHNDGRTQVVGNEKLLNEFPSTSNKYITEHRTQHKPTGR